MSAPKNFTLTEEVKTEISQHAQTTFPEECCGVVLSNGMTDRVVRLKNMQNARHAEDPEKYPRNATIAYSMDEQQLDSVCLEANRIGYVLKALYHSHPDHDAYFSTEDRAGATPFGEPTYPEAAQIVISVRSRMVREIRAFAWSDEKSDFVEIPINPI
jgi:proteasome lid subunit RPN8/RPN11